MHKLFDLGHSFQRRKRYYVFGHRNNDVLGVERAKAYSEALGVSHHFPETYSYSEGVVFIRDIWPSLHMIRFISPSVLNLDIGSNELALLTTHDPYECCLMLNELMDFITEANVPVTVVNHILKRTANIAGSEAVFEQNAREYNTRLAVFCGITDGISPYVVANPQRGFPSKPVAEWSNDGIHMRVDGISNENLIPMDRYIRQNNHVIFSQLGKLSL